MNIKRLILVETEKRLFETVNRNITETSTQLV